MSWTKNKQYIALLIEFPPFEECEDYYDFCDHVASLCKVHGVCIDDEGYLLDVDLAIKVKALLEVKDV